ncbi:MAG: S8 family serine peptidase, partial [Bacteroidales bacterium]|nr:S8 family serine peptidase [Bacteroidales bacterium]MDD4217419.1 S8 family serine peptidase [Bacteroidales bacterium]MDY0142687.1 S8 family serine peptidase [Bacteroidales bacterium]
MKKIEYIAISALLVLISISINAQTFYTVTKTTDPDPFVYEYNFDDNLCDPEMYGTLQWAIRKTNDTDGECVINFDIPGGGPHTISPLYYYPQITNTVLLDATTQAGYTEDNPAIILEGQNNIAAAFNCYNVDNIKIKGFRLNRFKSYGIILIGCNNSNISSNIITFPNPYYTLTKTGFTRIRIINCNNIDVYNNTLNAVIDGVFTTGQANLGLAFYNSNNCNVGSVETHFGNKIYDCYTGVLLNGSQNIKISANEIYNNENGILLENESNNSKKSPIILDYKEGVMSGIAEIGDNIEVFGSLGSEDAKEYLGNTIVDDDGNWSINLTTIYDYFISTATNTLNNTSEFSDAILVLPTCAKPTNLSATEGISTSHTLSWDGPSGVTYNVAVGVKDLNPLDDNWMISYSQVTGNSTTITALDENTEYEFYINANCGTELSYWVGPYVFNFPTVVVPETTRLTDEFCGATVYSDDIIEAISLSNVIGYRFFIINENTGDILEIESNDSFVNISEIIGEIDSDTYLSITVEGIYENMISQYGESCSVIVLPGYAFEPYAKSKIMIRLKYDIDLTYSDNTQSLPIAEIDSLINQYGITKINKLFNFMEDSTVNYPHVVHFDPLLNIEDIMDAFRELSFVKSVGYVPIYSYSVSPNDPIYEDNTFWHLNQINAESAWGIHEGANDVIVAILDNGFNTTHEDLMNNLWINPEEIPGNGIDDDDNGYEDDYNGYDVGNNDGNPHINVDNNNNFYGHGTHVAGIVGAQTNNLFGVASISSEVQLMLVKNSSDLGYFDHELAVQSLAYLVDNGINESVVNMSWGAFDGAEGLNQNDINELHLPIEALFNSGVILVAAVGNEGLELGNGIEHYPSAFPEVIAVGATNSDDMLAIQGVNNTTLSSNFGSSIDVMAPGVDIWSTMSGAIETENDVYIVSSGTSMASPLVAGLCALMRSYKPNADVNEIRNCLYSSCDPIDDINDTEYSGLLGNGRINAFEAMNCLMSEEILSAHFSSSSQTSCESEAISFFDESIGNPISWQWTVIPSDGVTFLPSNTSQNPDITFTNPGYYDITLTVTDINANTQSVSYYNYVFVQNPQVEMVHSNYFCLDDGNVGFCSDDVTMNSLDVCNGSTQTITLYFNSEPPFSAVVTDGVNTYDVNPAYYPCAFYPEYNYRASVNVIVTEEFNSFSIQSLEDNVCALEVYENTIITFNVHDCCPNLLFDGNFEGITEIPDNRTDLELETEDSHNEYRIFNDFLTNSHVMFIDGPTWQQVADAGNIDEQLLWASNPISVSENTDYIFSIDNSTGCHCRTLCSSIQNDWISSQQLKLSFKIVNTNTNEILVDNIVHCPSKFEPEIRFWITNNFHWHSDVSQTIRVEVYQVEEFGPSFYDYGLDNISLRAINENNPLTSNVNDYSDSSSPLACDGYANVIAFGGHQPYTYEWSNGQEIPNITNLCAGVYEVTITDANLCNTINSIEIESSSNITITIDSEDVSCHGLCDGSVNVVANGGVEPYIYNWSNGELTPEISDLCAGEYEVTVIDAIGDSNIGYVTINQNDEILASIVSYSNISCFGFSDGEATVVASGGTGSYTYTWDDSGMQTTSTAIALDEGLYTVIVTDENGCQTQNSIYISEPDLISLSIEIIEIPCSGNCTGSLHCNTSGGVSPYLYEWDYSTSQVTETADELCEDLYNITVSDANGCSTTDNIDLPSYDNPIINMPTEESICLGESVQIGGLSIVTGGIPTYDYSWSNGSLLNQYNISNPIATPTSTTPFTLVVEDSYGCTATETVTITVNPNPDVNAAISSFPNCPGQSTIISAEGINGTPTYNYSWTSLGTEQTYEVFPTEISEYFVTVNDANGCSGTSSVTADIAYSISSNVINSCEGVNSAQIILTLELHPLNSLSDYNVNWSNSSTTLLTNVGENIYQTTLSGLSPSSYSYTINDNLGCVITDIVAVFQTPVPLIVTTPEPSCPNEATGGIEIDITGGYDPYTFEWNNTANSQNLTNVYSGTYTLTTTDANNCTYTTSDFVDEYPDVDIDIVNTLASYDNESGNATLSFITTDIESYSFQLSSTTNSYTHFEPNLDLSQDFFVPHVPSGLYDVQIQSQNSCTSENQFSIADVITNIKPSCIGGNNNGEIELNITVYGEGNSLHATINWLDNNNNTYVSICAEMNAQPEMIKYQTILTGLAPSIYTYSLMDAWGNTITNDIIIEGYTEPVLTSNIENSCLFPDNGSIEIEVSEIDEPYTFLWSNGDDSQNMYNIAGGNYGLTFTYEDNCEYITSFVIPLFDEPALEFVNIQYSCFGDNTGIAQVNVTNDPPLPYTYDWSNGNYTPMAMHLSAGTHTVTVTDGNECISNASVEIGEFPEILVTTESSVLDCSNDCVGIAAVDASEGGGGFSYLWNDEASQETATATNLCSGDYNVIVTDANACMINVPITINSPTPIVIGVSTIDASCYEYNNGTATITAQGGTNGYMYDIGNGLQDENIFAQLQAGDYTVTVSDGNMCTAEIPFTIDQPLMWYANIYLQNNISCYGYNDGKVIISVGGNNPPYQYSIYQGIWQASNQFENLEADSYTVTVQDNNGCTVTTPEFEITEPPAITVMYDITQSLCSNDCDGEITAFANGGTGALSYHWSNENWTQEIENATISNLCDGTYELEVADGIGCKIEDVAVISSQFTSPEIPVIEIPSCLFINNTFDFTDIANSDPTLIWDWTIGGETITDDNQLEYTFNDYGYYCMSLTVGNNECGYESQTLEPIFVNPGICACDDSDGGYYDYPYTDGYTIYSNNNEIWSSTETLYVEGDIYIQPNAILTIGDNTRIEFAPNGRIIVEAGGKLIIEGNVYLTSILFPPWAQQGIDEGKFIPLCENNMWQGIEVWRDVIHPSNVGTVEIINKKDVVIENAHIGILSGARNMEYLCNNVSSPNPFDESKGCGHIIIAESDVNFINNGIGIKLLPRPNYMIGIGAYWSGNIINGCTFKTTQDLYDSHYSSINSNPYPNSHNPWAGYANQYQRTDVGIYMNGIKGLDIRSCTFDNM